VTDTTEFSLFGQKMYLSPALDSHNSYLVGYTLSDQSALDMAPPHVREGTYVHTRWNRIDFPF